MTATPDGAASRQPAAPYVVPPALNEYLHEGTEIVFYQPKLGHVLDPDAIFAVRTNEPFEDFKAAIESERAYVRKALRRAQEIFFHRCVNKHPVIIMRNFAGFEAGSRAIDSSPFAHAPSRGSTWATSSRPRRYTASPAQLKQSPPSHRSPNQRTTSTSRRHTWREPPWPTRTSMRSSSASLPNTSLSNACPTSSTQRTRTGSARSATAQESRKSHREAR
jgi:hypothetical protein